MRVPGASVIDKFQDGNTRSDNTVNERAIMGNGAEDASGNLPFQCDQPGTKATRVLLFEDDRPEAGDSRQPANCTSAAQDQRWTTKGEIVGESAGVEIGVAEEHDTQVKRLPE
jgi:hypothetical protein